jgi:hypothetical protein
VDSALKGVEHLEIQIFGGFFRRDGIRTRTELIKNGG